jgi:hypothetical protein
MPSRHDGRLGIATLRCPARLYGEQHPILLLELGFLRSSQRFGTSAMRALWMIGPARETSIQFHGSAAGTT